MHHSYNNKRVYLYGSKNCGLHNTDSTIKYGIQINEMSELLRQSEMKDLLNLTVLE